MMTQCYPDGCRPSGGEYLTRAPPGGLSRMEMFISGGVFLMTQCNPDGYKPSGGYYLTRAPPGGFDGMAGFMSLVNPLLGCWSRLYRLHFRAS